MDYIKMTRNAIESHYDALCDIIEKKDVKIGSITDDQEVTVKEKQPCRVSFENIYSSDETDTESKVIQKIKLFISPDLTIKPGSKIIVTRLGRTTGYKGSGEVALYETHQEIPLELWKGWA